jgi:hypothetical protein
LHTSANLIQAHQHLLHNLSRDAVVIQRHQTAWKKKKEAKKKQDRVAHNRRKRLSVDNPYRPA